MQIDCTGKEFRRLLDLVYIGNWVLNSTRGDDRFEDYDSLESKIFGLCRENGMQNLCQTIDGELVPSQAFIDGGIHEAIASYEDAVFFDILAEELSRRDMGYPDITDDNYCELVTRMDRYIDEFDAHGADHILVEGTEPT